MSVDIDLDSDDFQDITDSVEVYEKGKVFECECGQDFGTELDCRTKKCPTCGDILVDEGYESRDPPNREDGQSSIGEWL